MYQQFFGLEDEPFRLTPDPHYLFLSSKHAEALAHLRLGLTESSGFVCITGDVGTGKTTLLRCFLSELGSNVTAAYAFSPPLSALELLRRICREFGLAATGQSQGEFVEELYAYLVAQHQAGRLCVVVLDEAQALSIELLEQIRLLLNLETETQKLLRIVLVGQPQLRKLLLDPGLAQLNQRITLRWHLGPLSSRETVAYVDHRLAVANGGRRVHLFTRPALRLLYSVSGGVPRLINMVAHRALLAAFVARQTRVNRRLVAHAYRELQVVPLPGTLSTLRKAAWATAGLAIGVSLVAFGAPQLDRLLRAPLPAATPEPVASRAQDNDDAPPAPQAAAASEASSSNTAPSAAARAAVAAAPAPVAPAPVAPVPVAPAPVAPAPVAPAALASAEELARQLMSLETGASARAATEALLAVWGESPLAGNEVRLPEDLESVAWRRGLQSLSLTGNRSMLRLLNLPAIVALHLPGVKDLRYAAITAMDASRVVLSLSGVPRTLDAEAFERLWPGDAFVLWRDFEELGTVLRPGTRGIAVVRLQKLLRQAGTFGSEPTGVFDAMTNTAVLSFQRTHRLDPDGLVGPLTDIVLYGGGGGYLHPTLAIQAQGTS